MRKNPPKKNVILLWFCIFLFTAISRIVLLNHVPYDEYEAELSSEFFLGTGRFLGFFNNPLQYFVTKAIVFLFGIEKWIFRIIPATFGIVLVFLPFYFREMIGEIKALAFSTFFMLDPFLILNSRYLYGYSLTIFMMFVLLYALYKKKPHMAGFVFGLLICSGLSFIKGLLLLFSGLQLLNALFRNEKTLLESTNSYLRSVEITLFIRSALFCIALLVTFAAATGSIPISNISNSITWPLLQWNVFTYLSEINQKLLVLSSYGFLLWVTGILVGFWFKQKGSKIAELMLYLQLIFTIITIFTPIYKTIDLLWIFIPIYTNLVINFHTLMENQLERRKASPVIISLSLTILVIFLLLGILRIVSASWNQSMIINIVIGMFVAIILFVICIILFIQIESKEIIFKGIINGVVLLYAFLGLGTAYRVAGLGTEPGQELIRVGSVCLDAGEIENFVKEMRNLNRTNSELNSVVQNGYFPCALFELARIGVFPTNTIDIQGQFLLTSHLFEKESDRKYSGIYIRSTAYIDWVDQGLSVLNNPDYWKWLLLRQGKINKTQAYLAVNHEYIR